jgi:hypothetical protein
VRKARLPRQTALVSRWSAKNSLSSKALQTYQSRLVSAAKLKSDLSALQRLAAMQAIYFRSGGNGMAGWAHGL